MMRRQKIKWLMLIAFTLMATMTYADVPRPSYSYALPRSTWEEEVETLEREKRETERQEFLEKTGILAIKRKLDQNGRLGGWIVFLSPLVFGSIVVICLLRYIRFGGRKYVIAMALAAGPLSMSIFLFWLEFYGPQQNPVVRRDADTGSLEDWHRVIAVDPKLGETYEQYLERVRQLDVPPRYRDNDKSVERLEYFSDTR